MGSPISPLLTSGLGVSVPAGHRDSPEKIRQAASQFESLLIGQVLKSMHEDGEQGWLGSGEDQTAASAMSLADEYLAQAISQNGGLGLAKMIERQLDAPSNSSPATPGPETDDTPRTDP
ncbi:MAG TPA: rod-binding protein [Bryobacteraceae bacterium]|nr:rod-binding protein [Bryobacteraceae bacterium]